jgi:pseudoazurin
MLNVDPENSRIRNVFTPRLLVVDPGTNVLFEATDRGHNSASVDGMIPDGAEPWKGRIGADIEIQFSIPGFYGYVCTPHVPLGMVGLIVVQGDGMLDNLDAARAVRHRGKAGPVFEEIWAEVDELGLTSA